MLNRQVVPVLGWSEQNRKDATVYLIERGANLNSRTGAYLTPLDVALRMRHRELARVIFEAMNK